MTLQAGTRLGAYEVLGPLGAGGMGEVYKARDPRVERPVALKVLPEEFFENEERRQRFEREAKLLASLNHPGIATLYSFEEIPGSSSSSSTRILVMELLEGETLRERLRAGPLSVHKALDVAAQMARALAAAHAKGIVHRDLKPENVFLTRDGHVKVLDFGLAKAARANAGLTQVETETALSEAGAVVGTVGYMSPEQVRGEPVDHRSDVFSFGTILYELLTGKNPFRRDTPPESMTAILTHEPPPLSESVADVSPAVSAIVGRCLQKSAEQRFESASDLAFALVTQAAPYTGSLAPRPTVRPASRWASPAVRSLAAIAVLALLAAAWYVGRRTSRPRHPTFQRLTFRRGYVDGARFAPGGSTVLYGATFEGGPAHLYSARPGSPEASAVVREQAVLLAVSRAGEMGLSLNPVYRGYRWEGTLARAPLSGGAPRELLEGVEWADFTPDGSDLAIVRRQDGEGRLELPPGTLLFAGPGRVGQPRLSRDGRLVALGFYPGWAGDGELVVVDRSGRRTLTSRGWSSLHGIAWSPRGDEVWFTASREGRDQSLWAVTLGGRERLVARWGGNWILHDVSPDGRVLLTAGSWRLTTAISAPSGEREISWLDWSQTAALSRDGKTALLAEFGEGVAAKNVAYLRPVDGSPAVRLGDGAPTALSPDGKWALVSRTHPAAGLVLLPVGPGGERKLPQGTLTDFGWGDFFPDGRRIVFEGAETKGREGLWLQDLDGGPPRPFGPERFWHPLVAPDGRSILAQREGGKDAILAADGSVRKDLTLPSGTIPIAWAEDGGSIYVQRATDGLSRRIEKLDLEKGNFVPWREVHPVDPTGIIGSVHVHAITPDGRTVATGCLRNLNDLFLVEGLK